ncbi:MAG TPA: adenylate/guanylate cyclase domain-containing protein, partial [Ignavibacteria bacterium]|nr:adenylate/guanylate cyclase domain-containing protein [Ignavibacteria bacterium]
MINPPTGFVTFLFTEIENSSKLAHENVNYFSELELHNEIFRNVVEINNGYVFKTIGDAFCSSFQNPDDAVKAAIDAQKELHAFNIKGSSIKVSMGIHSGNAEWNFDDYIGYITLARTNRIMSSANGGQILISDFSKNFCTDDFLNTVKFRDFGERRLKDLKEPIRLYQIVHSDFPSEFPPIKTLDRRPNNLPELLTNFIGRENELSEIKHLLNNNRLVTLIGPGGTGKTRLAIQALAEISDEFLNGIWLIELAPLFDSELIPQTIAKVFGLNYQPEQDKYIMLSNYLKDKEILLLLDNCEHLIDDCSNLAQLLLQNCPGLKIIATSREALKCEGEVIFKVQSLKHPDPKKTETLSALSQFEAVQLFIERAVAVNPDFRINNENAPAVVQICYQLDGIPLAIELAAVRIKVLSADEIFKKLDDRFRLLTGGKRTALPRQQTLKALIDWSYELLSENEKTLFRRLSIFRGGWTIEAAQEICSDELIGKSEIMDLLFNLIDKSIVFTKEINGCARYFMLETIRQYSIEKNVANDNTYKNHFNYYLKLAEEPEYNKIERSEWKKTMEAEQDNLRSAIKWSMENFPEKAADIVIEAANYWEITGNYNESYSTLKKILALHTETDPDRIATILHNTAFMALNLEETESAENYLNEAFKLFKDRGNLKKTAECLNIYGLISMVKGKSDDTLKYFEECLALCESINEKHVSANVKGNMAVHYSGIGDSEKALKFIEESIAVYRELNYTDILAKMLISKGGIYYQEGELDKARICFEEGLVLLEEINDQFTLATTYY